MSLPSSLTASVSKARARVDTLRAALDRLSFDAEDLAVQRNRFLMDGEELLARIVRLEEADVSARARLLDDYQKLADRLEEHCRILIEAGQSYRTALLHASPAAESGSALERSSALFGRSEAVRQSLRRMEDGPAARHNRHQA